MSASTRRARARRRTVTVNGHLFRVVRLTGSGTLAAVNVHGAVAAVHRTRDGLLDALRRAGRVAS